MADKNPRILLIIDEASVGGGQQHVLWLAQYMDKRRYEVAVACEPAGYLVDKLKELSIPHYPVVMSNKISISSLLQCRNVIKAFMPSIVHTHGGTAGFYGRLASLLARVPFIVHTYHGIHYLHWKRSVKRAVFHFLDRILVRYTDMIICVAQNDYSLALSYGLVREKNYAIIPNGIDVKRYKVRPRSARNTKGSKKSLSTTVIGTVGRLHEQKGHKYFLRAAQKLLLEDPNVRFHIVGDGELRDQLEQLAGQLGIAHAVQFLGARTDIPEQLAAIDVFVLSSLWEGLPIVLLEAMAARKPIVSTSVNGVTEMLKDGESALLIPAKDPDVLAKGITTLLQDRNLAKRLAGNAHSLVCEKYDVRVMVSRTEEIYQQMLLQGE